MNGLLTLAEDTWGWLVFVALAGGGRWVARRFDAGVTAIGRQRADKVRHRQELRRLELGAKQRELEAAHPHMVKPICGCGHDLAFHDQAASVCHHSESEARCACQRYVGPEPLGQVYLPPLSGLADRT